MDWNDYARPDDGDLLNASMRALAAEFRPAVLFAGQQRADALELTHFLGTDTASLKRLHIAPGAGLGGRVAALGRPGLVAEYVSAADITHEYDAAVSRERIRSVAAAPVLVRGKVRSVLYIASRDAAPLGERAVDGVAGACSKMAVELAVRDEVDRRVALLAHAGADAAAAHDRAWAEHVREAHADIRSLARRVGDPGLAAQLERIGGLLVPGGADDGEGPAAAGNAPSAVVRLSPRELDVLSHVALGCSSEETAERLALRSATVKSYLKSAMAKLGVHRRLEAVSVARRLGLLP